MSDSWLLLPLLGFLLLYVTPALLGIGHVLRNNQPRVWILLFFCMPLAGPMLYMMWPKGGPSRPPR